MKLRYDFYDTDDLGMLALVATQKGLACIAFMDDEEPWREKLQERFAKADLVHDGEPLEDIVEWLDRYFAGEHVSATDYDGPLDAGGTQFQKKVWKRLGTIPYGQTISYGQVATELGDGGAMRAVGMANGANPLPILWPCHRVVGSKGELTGFGGGLWRKSALLERERGGKQYEMFA